MTPQDKAKLVLDCAYDFKEIRYHEPLGFPVERAALEAFLATEEESLTLTNGKYSMEFSREQVANIIEVMNKNEYRDLRRVQ